jgi:hypothetical protein
MLQEKMNQSQSGILLYGITPPKLDTPDEKIAEIASKQLIRLRNLPIDALVLYDIQDEAGRTSVARPFPFIVTIDPLLYREKYLSELPFPSIIYACTGKHTDNSFVNWLSHPALSKHLSVFVGSATGKHASQLSMKHAYELHSTHNNTLKIGGVTIAERHIKKGDEHLRIIDKQKSGCTFFISQCVYNLDASKNLLSDLFYYCHDNNLKQPVMIFTLTPCGSLRTLQFMEWLGISIPSWLKNDLSRSGDILLASMNICKFIARELLFFAKDKNIPIGFNIESVAIRKAEIDASIELLYYVNDLFKQ